MIIKNGKPERSLKVKESQNLHIIQPKIPVIKLNLKKDFDPLVIDCPSTDNIFTARYVMIGDAPTNVEVLEGEPFIGPAGSQLNRILAAAQLPRYEIYLTNACKTQLPKGDSSILWTQKGYRHPAWGELQKNLIEELSKFNGKFIMLLGATAMNLLLDSSKINSITKHRGSHYFADDFPHLKDKLSGKIIILTYHPSYTLPFKDPKSFYTMIFDVTKMIRMDKDPTLYQNYPTFIIRPSFERVLEFLSLVQTKNIIAFDIEATPKFITCFSVAIREDQTITSMSVPLMDNAGNYWTTEQETMIWIRLAKILINPDIKIICQNGNFDLVFLLKTLGILSDNFHFDTMLAQHLVYTELPKGLDFLTSIYTYFPYYKGEGKESHLAIIKDWDSYWLYNAKDSAYLFPIMDSLIEELTSFEALDAMEYQMNLHKPIIEMEFNGLKADKEGIIIYRNKLAKRINALQKGLNKISQKELNVGSSKQLISYFYGILQIKPYINRDTGNASCDTVALHRIAKKEKKGSFEAKIILKIRKYEKLLSTYFKVNNIDLDNKLSCDYKITGTVSGRLASSKTYFESPSGEKLGANLQNQPYEYKKYLSAWENKIFCEVDLAKAEAHVVAYLCQDENMIEAFESGIDVHSFNASKIFNCSLDEIINESKSGMEDKKTRRYMGKKVVHASNYKMGSLTFSDQLATENIFMSQSECKELLNNYKDRFPGLSRWHSEIEHEVRSSRVLYNLFGRPRRFLGIMNAALYGNAYSYKPQSTVAELLNRGMIKIVNDPRLGKELYNIDLLVTVHDSLGFQFDISQIKNLLNILLIIKEHMTHTFTYLGRSFTIGLDAAIGHSWKGKVGKIDKFDQENVNKALTKIGI